MRTYVKPAFTVLLFAVLTGLSIAGCQPGESGKASTRQTAAAAPATAGASGGLTYSATLTFTKVKQNGESSPEAEVLCTGLPIADEVSKRRNCLEMELKYYEALKSFTGIISNASVGDLIPPFEMRDVKLAIKVSNGQEFTWTPHNGSLPCGCGEGIQIPAPGLLKK